MNTLIITYKRDAIRISEHALASVIHGEMVQETKNDRPLLFVVDEGHEFGKQARLHDLISVEYNVHNNHEKQPSE